MSTATPSENGSTGSSSNTQVPPREYSKLIVDPSDPDMINIEGTIRYLEALGLDPEEPVVLVLAYQLDSPAIGAFSRTGFVEGWRTIG